MLNTFNFTKLLRDNLEGDADVSRYSGRAMFSRECLSLQGSLLDIRLTIAHALNDLHDTIVQYEIEQATNEDEIDDDLAPNIPSFDHVCSTLLNYRQDQLGLGIVVYWPDVKYGPGDDDGEDEDGTEEEGIEAVG